MQKKTSNIDKRAVKALTNNFREWLQFEVDLIKCIRDNYPILYKSKATKCHYIHLANEAWKEIGQIFPKLPVQYLRRRWAKIRSHYIKNYKNRDKTIAPDSSKPNKFLDGSLSFLDDVNQYSSDAENDELNTNDMDKASVINKLGWTPPLKQHEVVVHETIDLSDEEIEAKQEVKDITHEDITISGCSANNDINTDAEKACVLDGEKKWNEEELLNATRLTQEMIEELIRIKTKRDTFTLASNNLVENNIVVNVDSDSNEA